MGNAVKADHSDGTKADVEPGNAASDALWTGTRGSA
jgi:hypothetical protein